MVFLLIILKTHLIRIMSKLNFHIIYDVSQPWLFVHKQALKTGNEVQSCIFFNFIFMQSGKLLSVQDCKMHNVVWKRIAEFLSATEIRYKWQQINLTRNSPKTRNEFALQILTSSSVWVWECSCVSGSMCVCVCVWGASVFSRVHLGHFIYAACWPGICHIWRGGHQKHFTSAGPPEFEWLAGWKNIWHRCGLFTGLEQIARMSGDSRN